MRTRMIFLMVLVVLLALPMALYAQETDLAALVVASDEALNAGDLEGVLSYYADDAVFETVPFAKYTGMEEIRAYMEEAIALNATVEHEILQVEGDTVTLTSWYTDDDLRALGLNLEGIQEVTFKDGKIVSAVWTATDETMAALEAAMAALPETGGGSFAHLRPGYGPGWACSCRWPGHEVAASPFLSGARIQGTGNADSVSEPGAWQQRAGLLAF